MKKCNQDIRKAAANAGVYLWQVANRLNMHDSALARRLRYELSREEKEEILQAIKKLGKESHDD